ncbi:acyl-CoA synthetase [Denitrobaculum tricleocarpae]|uniref:AMP-binding protein n=1 Tax=Denitrobaculum tricleocarpae TaxID=2591009 RepID=A0A545TXW5_9PROT|nr:acyl-CoA synthetase [Denitrobaculum tricleocarpae]TQV82063.1 AMP-binding protein [Denitrobaculum tricleocarpae]
MLTPGDSYDEVYKNLNWSIPQHFNIGIDVCDKWADSDRLALIHKTSDGRTARYSFRDLKALSNKLANVFKSLGLEREDRIGILLPQAPETAITHIAAYKMGAIAIPLFSLFGEEALEYRLSDSGARAVVTDNAGAARLAEIRNRLPDLRHVLCIDSPPDSPEASALLDFHGLLEPASPDFTPVDTLAEDPALIIYTSGTTGPPKGALHAHRVLLGHLPGVEFPHEFFPQADDLFWTPADWAWIGGLLDVLLPAWHHGVPVLAHRFAKFEPEAAFALMAEFKVRNAFMPPTALKMMRRVEKPQERWDLDLRSIGSGGESLGEELLTWGREAFGVTINEFYGQTECNLVVGNCANLMPVKPGAMGRAVPGHEVAVVDDAGLPLPAGEEGNIGIRRPDPVMFLRYWNNPEATGKKFAGDWLLTGDRGRLDQDGYFHFVGRDDDVITSGGYRIGPGEIEDCLIKHPAIAMAAVIGVPDPLRTERVKAFVVLKPDVEGSKDLAREIQAFVKVRLAAHEYPREVAFVEELPMTTTGKIIRKALRALET